MDVLYYVLTDKFDETLPEGYVENDLISNDPFGPCGRLDEEALIESF